MKTLLEIVLITCICPTVVALCCCCRNQKHLEEEQSGELCESTEDINSEIYNNCVECICGAMIAPGKDTIIKDGCNCWGWAIEKITDNFKNENPPGYFKECKINELAEMTANGVKALGADAKILGELSNDELQEQISNLKNNEYLIAMRVGSTTICKNVTMHYYHYMRYTDGIWSHKAGVQGNFYKLINNSNPNDNIVWTAPISGDPEERIHLSQNRKKDLQIYKSCRTHYVKVMINNFIE